MTSCNAATSEEYLTDRLEVNGWDDQRNVKGRDRPAVSRRGALGSIAGMVFFASGCGREPGDSAQASRSTAAWPRVVEGDRGKIVLARPPRRIVSTSVTLTGTLLTIGAPVIASAATQADTNVADGLGFFRQWGDVARKRDVKPIYTGEPNVEAVAAMAPDLILVADTGGDSALRVVDQLKQIAPVLVLDYGNKSWQELARLLGEATGREAEAVEIMASYDARVSALRAKLHLPPQPTTAMVYYENGSGANIWTPVSAQGKLLKDLGFTLAQVPSFVRTSQAMGQRNDVLQISGEQFADALTGRTILLFSADDTTVAAVRSNRFLAHVPAIKDGRVLAMGRETFRIDYYSGLALLDRIESLFS